LFVAVAGGEEFAVFEVELGGAGFQTAGRS
jgi:hypothetical protein